MTTTYEAIRKLMEKHKRPGERPRVQDWLALSSKNDPFYVGTPGDLEHAEWFADIWHRGGFRRGAHLRRMHYWLVSQENPTKPDGTPYQNTDNDWGCLCAAGKAARYLGLVSMEDISDNRNPAAHVFAEYGYGEVGPPEYYVAKPRLGTPAIHTDGFPSRAEAQAYHLEIWCEKSTMNDVLLPICRRYNANLVTGEGEMSITAVCVDLERRIRLADRPVRIFYISDFDPAGQSMPNATARKIEWALRDGDPDGTTALDVRLTPLVLTAEQQRHYQLPRTPIKPSELRRAKFEGVYAQGAVELDALEALHPGELRRIVTEALDPYYDEDLEETIKQQERGLREAVEARVREVMDEYQEELAALEALNEALEEIEVDTTPYQVEPAVADAVETLPWLLDSRRTYTEQLEAYQAFKSGALVQEDN